MVDKTVSATPDNKRLSEKKNKIHRTKNNAKSNSDKLTRIFQEKSDDRKNPDLLILESIPIESPCAVFFAKQKNIDNENISVENPQEKIIQFRQELFRKICDNAAVFGQKTLLILSPECNSKYGCDIRSILRKRIAYTLFITEQTAARTKKSARCSIETNNPQEQTERNTEKIPVNEYKDLYNEKGSSLNEIKSSCNENRNSMDKTDNSFNDAHNRLNETAAVGNNNEILSDTKDNAQQVSKENENSHNKADCSDGDAAYSLNKDEGLLNKASYPHDGQSCPSDENASSFNESANSYNEHLNSLHKTVNTHDEYNDSLTDVFLQERDFINAKKLLLMNDDVRSILVCGGHSEINLAKRLSTVHELPMLVLWTKPDCDDVLSPYYSSFSQGRALRHSSVIPDSLYVNISEPISSLEMRCGTGFIAKALITMFEMDYLGDTTPLESIISIIKNCLFTRLDLPESNNKHLLFSSLLSLSAIKNNDCISQDGIDGLMDTLSTIGINPYRYAYACSRIITDIYKAALENCELEICLPPAPLMRSIRLNTTKITETASMMTSSHPDLHIPLISDKIMRLDKSLSLFESSCDLSRLPISPQKLRNAINNSVCLYRGSSFLKDLYLSGFLGR